MYDKIPRFYGLRQKCTDCYCVYENVIPYSFHLQCEKGSGGTSRVVGVNTALCHHLSYLVRKSSSFARSEEGLLRRLRYVLDCYNRWIAKRRLKEKQRQK